MTALIYNSLPPMKNFPDEGKPRKLRFSWALWWATVIVSALAACAAKGAPAIPAVAVSLATQDWQARASNPFVRYLWSPSASDADFQAATVALNVAVNQGSIEYSPPRVAGGALLLVDLGQLADDEKQLSRLVSLWDGLAFHDPYFHYSQSREVAGDKKTKSHTETILATAPHTGEQGTALGIGRVYRVDQFSAAVLSSVDGGAYLDFRGLKLGQTKLDDYLASRGASLKTAEKLNAVDQGVQLSEITGKVRGWAIWHGQGIKPSVGRPLVAITKDVADGQLDPNRNAMLSLLNDKFDAFELILVLPTGQQEFTLWNSKGELLAEAAANVATDHTVPAPFTNRLQSAISCIRCHGPDEGLKPIRNDVLAVVGGNGRILTDLSKGVNRQFDALRLIQSRYGATQHDIDAAILDSRESLNRRYDTVAHAKDAHAAKESYLAASKVFDSYRHAWVTPEIACRELGFEAGKSAGATLRAALPAPNPLGALAEGSAGVLAQLEAGLSVTRDDFESVYPELETKAVVTLQKDAVVEAKKGLNFKPAKVMP